MPWRDVTLMSQRLEFINLALAEDANISELCRRFNISRKTAYKWISRYFREGPKGLIDRSRCPHRSPNKCSEFLEQTVLDLRKKHQQWGGRKIRKRLEALGFQNLPAASTITNILKRHNCISPEESCKHKAWQRFEAESPNDLWQMDFKGYFEAADGRCNPLTILDDHSRYSLCIQGCRDQTGITVKEQMRRVFQYYGLPRCILVDNGSPWGTDARYRYTPLTVWLIRQGITVIHSRPYHPQTLGKDERFHRSLKAEVIQYCTAKSLNECQFEFDRWRHTYNQHRPHEALKMDVPANHYYVSSRCFEDKLPPIEYAPDVEVRKVQQDGKISFRNKNHRVGKSFLGERVAIRPTETDGLFDVFFCNQKIRQINLKT